MKVSEREKKYLIALAIIVLVGAIYMVVTQLFTPQRVKLEALSVELEQQQIVRQTTELKIARADELQKAQASEWQKAFDATDKLFPTLDQDKLLRLLGQLFEDSGLEAANMTFAKPNLMSFPGVEAIPKQLGFLEILANQIRTGIVPTTEVPVAPGAEPIEVQVKMTEISFEFTCEYDQLQRFIENCEQVKHTIAITSLTVTNNADDPLSGTMNLALFSTEKLESEEFMEWTPEKGSEKTELFTQQYVVPVAETVPPAP